MDTASPEEIDALKRHYLKKELFSLLIADELNFVSEPTNLDHLGSPFVEKGKSVIPYEKSQIPVLRFIFKRFILTFPFLDPDSQNQLWNVNFRNLLKSLSKSNVSVLPDDSDATHLHKWLLKFQNMLTLLMSRAFHSIQDEKNINIELLDTPKLEKDLHKSELQQKPNILEAYVLGVRQSTQAKMLRTKRVYEYLIKVSYEENTFFIARKYSDFSHFHHLLLKSYPNAYVPRLPPKDDHDTYLNSSEDSTLSPLPSRSSDTNDPQSDSQHVLRQERMRIELRQYIKNILNDDELHLTEEVLSFLTDDPVTLTASELTDINFRQELDVIRQLEQQKFVEIASQRAKELDVYMEEFKRSLTENNGFTTLFTELKEKNSISELSPSLQKTIEWARVNLASTIYDTFIGKEKSLETYLQIKKMHQLFPYTVIKNIMRFSNPLSVMKRILDTLLAQPFGMKSLFQRLLSISLNENVRAIHKLISRYEARIVSPEILAKIQEQVENPCKAAREVLEKKQMKRHDYLYFILISDDVPPKLPDNLIRRVYAERTAWKAALDSEDYPTDPTVIRRSKRYGYMMKLMHLYAKQFNKRRSISLISEGVTGEIMKSMVDSPELNPNILVEQFIDLVRRHEDSFYDFVHRVYLHDSGLFASLMEWIENIIGFLRQGTSAPIDMDLVVDALDEESRQALDVELNKLLKWNQRKKSALFLRKTTKYIPGEETSLPVTMDELGIDEEIMAELRGDEDDQDENDQVTKVEEEHMEDDDSVEEFDPIIEERQRMKRKANRPANIIPPKPKLRTVKTLLPAFKEQVYPILHKFVSENEKDI
ncbi:hypothetical protein POMI540_2211 [Schizosaccharomyces pombe]